MYCKNRRLSLAYKLLSILVCIVGQVTLHLALGARLSQYFYYTNQSNLLCLVYFVWAAVHCAKRIRQSGPEGEATLAPRFKGAVVMAITVTMLIYWLLLNGSSFSMAAGATGSPTATPMYTLSNYIVHLAVPLLMIFDWLLFDPKGAFRPFDPVLWEVIPLVYYLFTLVVAQTGFTYRPGQRYPYFFINPDMVGARGVAIYLVVLVVVFLVLGYLVYGLDKLLARIAVRRARQDKRV